MSTAGHVDSLHLPVHDDGPPEDVSQAEHVQLLQTLPLLAGQGQQAGPFLSTVTRQPGRYSKQAQLNLWGFNSIIGCITRETMNYSPPTTEILLE